MYLWMKGHRAGEAADKRLFIYQIRSVNIYPKLTKVPTTPNAHCHCIPSFQGKGIALKYTNSQALHRSWQVWCEV